MKFWNRIGLVILILLFSFGAFAQQVSPDPQLKQKLEDWFSAMQAKDMDKAASFLAPEFVSVHTDQIVRSKDEEIALIKNLNQTSHHLSDFKFFHSGDVVTVTFKNKGRETIDKKKIAKPAALRMAVFQKQGDQWLIIAYANMTKIG